MFLFLRYVSCDFWALSLEWLGKGTRWHMLCFFSGVWKEGAVLQFETGGFVKKNMLYFKVFLLFICSNSAESDRFGHYFSEGLKQKQQPLAFWWSIIKSNGLPWPLSDPYFQHFSNTGSIFQTRQEFRALARIFCLLHVLHKNQRKPEKMCLGETPPVGSSRTLDPCHQYINGSMTWSL